MKPDKDKSTTELIAEVRLLREQLERTDRAVVDRVAVQEVRNAALAMRTVEDLRHVAAALFRALRLPHPEVLGCNLAVVDEERERVLDYAAKQSPRHFGITWTSKDLVEVSADIAVGIREYDPGHPNYQQYLDMWRKGHVWEMDGHGDDFNRPTGFAEDFGLSRAEESYFPPDVRIVIVPFEHGSVSVHTTAADDGVVNLVRQFAEAVEIGYVRFLDFRRLLDAQQKRLQGYEQELERARAMQVGLLPPRPPRIPGYSFAASCTPARKVGGDMYRAYMVDGKLVGFLADASGHAMGAAIPLMIFAGILETHVEAGGGLSKIFERINRSLCRVLPERTFVCLSMGMLDPETSELTVSNAGCPYPFHYNASTESLTELELDAYPLGVRESTTFGELTVPIGRGDQVVYCSDGLVEAMDANGEPFGFERLAELIQQSCRQGMTAGRLRRHIVNTVVEYQDGEAQDDMTIIVTGARKA